MRIILDTEIDNDELPLIDQRIPLITDTLVAGYDMMSNRDFSGHGNHFSWNGTFDSNGAVLKNSPESIIKTPVMEQDEFTVIFCCNIANDGIAKSFFNNFDTSTNMYTGTRLVALDNNSGQLNVASGIGSGSSLTALGLTFTGAWTVRTLSWNSRLIRQITHGGSQNEMAMTNRGIGKKNPFFINGVPSNVSAGSIIAGASGYLGMILFYKEFIDATTAVQRMDTITDIMAKRGVTVP